MHEIAIPSTVIDAIKARRGRLNRYESLEPEKTALVVIDLQNAFMLPGAPIEAPIAREIVPNVNRLAASVRSTGGTVVWVQMTHDESDREGWSVFFDQVPDAAASVLATGSPGHDLYADLDVQPSDRFVRKNRFSAFIRGSSDIDARLRGLGIDTVIVVGTLTNICSESSARDAMMLNYKVVFVSDGNAALDDADHNASFGPLAMCEAPTR